MKERDPSSLTQALDEICELQQQVKSLQLQLETLKTQARVRVLNTR